MNIPSFPKFFVFAFLFFVSSQVFSQYLVDGFYHGFIINNDNDTVYTKVKWLPLTKRYKLEKLPTKNAREKRVVYLKDEILGYKVGTELFFKREHKFRSIPGIKGKDAFMKVYHPKEEVKLLELQYSIPDPYQRITETQFYIERNKNSYLIERQNYAHSVANLFKDHEILSKKIKENNFTYYELPLVVGIYNTWLKTQ